MGGMAGRVTPKSSSKRFILAWRANLFFMGSMQNVTKVILKDGLQTAGIDKEIYIAVISMALKEYEDDVHDIESNVITIKPHHTNWTLPHPDEPVIS